MSLVQRKICLLGEFAVGKTSLVRRYVEGRFDDKYLCTIGVKVSRKVIDRKGFQIALLIWDMAGGEDFSGHDMNYLRGAAGALLVCDLTRAETLDYSIKYAQLMCEINPDAKLVIAANKADLTEDRKIHDADLDKFQQTIGCPYMLTSAKTGENVENSILLLVELLESRTDDIVA